MIYTILKYLVWIGIHIYFRKIEFTNLHQVPKKGPVLLLGSHPNSFLDAVVLAVMLKRPLHFLARSDVFKTAWQRWILGKLHMIPIYRLEEGKENLGKNQSTFEQCKALFEAGEMVLIFPEGFSIPEKRLRKLKKGAAKIAFESEEANGFQLNIKVICVGINYTYPTQARESLLVRFDTPFSTQEFEQSYQEHAARAIRLFNQKIEERLPQHTVIIPEKSQEKLAENLLTLARNAQYKTNSPTKNLLSTELEAVAHLSRLTPAQSEEIERYFDQLTQTGLQDIDLAKDQKITFGQTLAYYLGLPFYFLSYLFYFFPTHYARKIADDKTKNTQFYLSVDFALHFFFILFYLLFWWIVLAVFTKIWVASLSVLLFMGLGRFTLYYSVLKKRFTHTQHCQKIKKQQGKLIETLHAKRVEIMGYF